MIQLPTLNSQLWHLRVVQPWTNYDFSRSAFLIYKTGVASIGLLGKCDSIYESTQRSDYFMNGSAVTSVSMTFLPKFSVPLTTAPQPDEP